MHGVFDGKFLLDEGGGGGRHESLLRTQPRPGRWDVDLKAKALQPATCCITVPLAHVRRLPGMREKEVIKSVEIVGRLHEIKFLNSNQSELNRI